MSFVMQLYLLLPSFLTSPSNASNNHSSDNTASLCDILTDTDLVGQDQAQLESVVGNIGVSSSTGEGGSSDDSGGSGTESGEHFW